MSSRSRLVWSSREQLRAQLLNLLETTPPESSDARCRALRLLGIFDDAPLPLLRSLLLDPATDLDLRHMALGVGSKHGLWLSGTELARLHEERTASGDPVFPMEYVLLFARLDGFTSSMKSVLLRLAPQERAQLLVTLMRGRPPRQLPRLTRRSRADLEARDHELARLFHSSIAVEQPRDFVDWLFTRWCESDRGRLEALDDLGRALNFDVALAQRERPEARELLIAWSQDQSPEELERKVCRPSGMSRNEFSRFVATLPALRQRAAEALMLPLEDLRAYFGDDGLLNRLDAVIRAQSAAFHTPYGLLAHPPAFVWARDILAAWTEARRRVLSPRLCDVGLAELVRIQLLDRLWHSEPAVAMKWAQVAMRYPGNASLVVRVLHLALDSRSPDARPLFLAALREPDEAMRSLAIEGLVVLGEASVTWTEQLVSLANDGPLKLRLHALAGLIQQGDRQWLGALRQVAREATAPEVRAQALRWLGVLDGEASRSLFMEVLAQAPSIETEPRLGPELAEAILALSELGTDEDLSALLELAQRGYVCAWLEDLFAHHLAQQGF
ncbi:HEAT repeat domain-containing protein [Corallococcus interemptor]|uniref:HEAT repeat domain-containing protein n=1 Tax=Corallococcus interemptor TaxID=2316720 RepID=UPI003CFE1BFE